MTEVVVSIQQMYDLLLEVDRKVTALTQSEFQQKSMLDDHEIRIRTIEAEEDVSRRVGEIERQVEEMKRKLWALPSAGVVIAAVAVVITLVLNF